MKNLKFTKIISGLFLLLMISYLISVFAIGGDALSGKIENGKYYVWDAIKKSDENGQTVYLEVSKGKYFYNLTNSYLLFLIMPFFLFFTIIEYRNKRNTKQNH